MHQNWMNLTNKLKLTIVGGLAVSASIVSALTFINLPGNSNSLLAQNNSGNDQYGTQNGTGNIQGGRNNDNSRRNSPTYNNPKTYSIDARSPRDQRRYQRSTTNNCQYSQGSACGNGTTQHNQFK